MIDFILEEGLIMIPTLFVIAEIIKAMEIINARYIPAILLVISLAMTPLILQGGYTADNIVQAILVTGGTVLGYEVYKETIRGDD